LSIDVHFQQPAAAPSPAMIGEFRLGVLYAFYQGLIGVGIEPGQLGAAYFIPTVVVPLSHISTSLALN
jgi:hypothetical protein